MGRPLDEPLPDTPSADGVRIAPWTLELDDATRDAHNEAFLDHWGSEPNTPDEWRHHHRDSPAFRGDLSRLALDGDRVVGYVVVHRFAEEDELLGMRVAWLGSIGVRRAYRRRGIASALIVATLAAFREAGLERADLGVDADNLTGAFGLYERLGFRTLRRNTMFGRYLPAADR
jgi:ribosomal protein S18 acetylase RimI-like enzyme